MSNIDQIANTLWMIEYINSNAQSFSYDVAGYWDSAQEALNTFCVDEDEARRDVGETGLTIIESYCKTGDGDAVAQAINEWTRST